MTHDAQEFTFKNFRTMQHIKTLTIDNPLTSQREWWKDGQLIYSYSRKIQAMFRFENGRWDEKQYIGDITAMGRDRLDCLLRFYESHDGKLKAKYA